MAVRTSGDQSSWILCPLGLGGADDPQLRGRAPGSARPAPALAAWEGEGGGGAWGLLVSRATLSWLSGLWWPHAVPAGLGEPQVQSTPRLGSVGHGSTRFVDVGEQVLWDLGWRSANPGGEQPRGHPSLALGPSAPPVHPSAAPYPGKIPGEGVLPGCQGAWPWVALPGELGW